MQLGRVRWEDTLTRHDYVQVTREVMSCDITVVVIIGISLLIFPESKARFIGYLILARNRLYATDIVGVGYIPKRMQDARYSEQFFFLVHFFTLLHLSNTSYLP